ncbi:hypothetical protein CVT26_008961 [Gymnopilus dilepis]|uniref:Uncharacterized protein n=1 Tax=Gymnopilus dilepis TaxID=231916 RepID=A0A409YRV3_9AGAR|nr:hypothetical protein CVT26_008961 [Gymnopilus dilepis]
MDLGYVSGRHVGDEYPVKAQERQAVSSGSHLIPYTPLSKGDCGPDMKSLADRGEDSVEEALESTR